ncbi:hypothetical protein NN677_004904 [Salmonella enterica]|nr:hypothetical protein [Salmonella enterica subsp. diarizonae]EJM2521370.1 hypothetical protein [Salmonella enterica]
MKKEYEITEHSNKTLSAIIPISILIDTMTNAMTDNGLRKDDILREWLQDFLSVSRAYCAGLILYHLALAERINKIPDVQNYFLNNECLIQIEIVRIDDEIMDMLIKIPVFTDFNKIPFSDKATFGKRTVLVALTDSTYLPRQHPA